MLLSWNTEKSLGRFFSKLYLSKTFNSSFNLLLHLTHLIHHLLNYLFSSLVEFATSDSVAGSDIYVIFTPSVIEGVG